MNLKHYGRLLVQYLRSQKGRAALLGLLILGSIALQLINPQLVRRFLDAAETGRTLDELVRTAVFFTSISIFAQLFMLAGTYVGEIVAWTATNDLRADLALHCLKLDMSFHKTHKPGELIERVDGDVNQLANFFSQLIIQLGSNLLLVFGVLVLLWLEDWRVGVSVTAVAFIGLATLNQLNRYLVPRWQKVRALEADLFGYLEEWLTGTEEIQTNGAAPYILRRLYELMRRRWRLVQSAMRLNLWVIGLPIIVPGIAYVVAFFWGDHLFRSSVMTVGTVYLIFYYIDVIRGPLWAIQRQVQDLQRAAASLNRITALFAEQPTIHDGSNAVLPDGPLSVQFAGVSFVYDDDLRVPYSVSREPSADGESSETEHGTRITDYDPSAVLKNVTFTLEPGRILGLLGRTGSGKTTISRLLLRFYDPTEGAIRLGTPPPQSSPDGGGSKTPLPKGGAGGGLIDLRHTTQSEIRRRVGMVTQDVELFHASVRDNLTLFDDSVDDGRLLTALDELGLTTWLAALPNGLDTRLDASHSLSAGEAQLLALARVFLSDPGLVILDEASSRLDPATEALLERAIDKLLAGRTAVIIAHRLHTVQRADEIMVLGNGRIFEHGSRAVLAADPNSEFFSLLQTGLEEAIA
ncbi:MAG: ABC transporter ATP-binding protein [Ardenticatenaceae bacterium]|nr:ABC transporter ATP-binding protein [Ardenticatenaceae bacterium]MCB9444646.1 ABC transporter ATP-binding protein [Ardenticatenaceae bacterium]